MTSVGLSRREWLWKSIQVGVSAVLFNGATGKVAAALSLPGAPPQGSPAAEANVIPKPPAVRQNTVVIFGDSITRRLYNGGDPRHYGTDSYFVWANICLGQRLQLLNNAGVSGETTALMLARIQASVLDYKPGWCIVEGGINDVQSGASVTAISNNLRRIYETLIDAGIRPVATTVTTKTGAPLAQKTVIHLVNQWLKNYCWSNPSVALCDWAGNVTDPATGDWAAGMSSDGVHPTTAGAARMGKALADTLRPIVPVVDLLPISNIDPDNLLSNGMFTGDNGSGLATGWQVLNGGTYKLSKVARTDGKQGHWQQFSQTAVGAWELQFKMLNDQVNTRWAAGDTVYGVVEFETDNNLAAGHLNLSVYQEGGSGTAEAPFYAGADVQEDFPTAGVFRTKPLTIQPGAKRLGLSVWFNGTGTVRIARAKLAKGTPGL